MWCVEVELQEFAMACCSVMVHLFGDVPSNVVMGAVRKATREDSDPRAWRWMFYSGELGIVPGIGFLGAAVVAGNIATRRKALLVDKFEIGNDLLSSAESPG